MAGSPLAAGVAGALVFSSAAALLVGIVGNPKAGTPEVRLSLARIDPLATSNGALNSGPSAAGAAPSTEASDDSTVVMTSAPDSGDLAETSPIVGEAVITLPDEASPAAQGNGESNLPQAPLPGLSVPSPSGSLPVVAADGRTAAKAYARPFVANGKPKIALVIGGLGLNAKATRDAIETLPPEVTLSFVPYADGLQGWIDMARAAGHEVLLEAPMEPTDYPDDDPGPYTLLAGGSADDATRKLDWLMSRATGYFGLTNYLGGKFTASPAAMANFEAILKNRGLAFIDDGQAAHSGGGIPRASANRVIDDQLSGPAINQQLAALESEARKSGAALGSGFAYPITLEETARWAKALDQRGYQLAPASALAVLR
ncbi:MAG: divergent polysaccharide deacetylase family protein [Caulobacteraceae bacterium]